MVWVLAGCDGGLDWHPAYWDGVHDLRAGSVEIRGLLLRGALRMGDDYRPAALQGWREIFNRLGNIWSHRGAGVTGNHHHPGGFHPRYDPVPCYRCMFVPLNFKRG